MRLSPPPKLTDIRELGGSYLGSLIDLFSQWFNDHDTGYRLWTTLSTTGGLRTGVKSTAVNYTATSTDHIVLADSTSAAITITLPTAVGVTGRWYIVKCSAGNNPVTVATTASQTIDSLTSVVLPKSGYMLWVVSDGSNWQVLG